MRQLGLQEALLPKPSTQDILDDLALDKAIREAECLAAALL